MSSTINLKALGLNTSPNALDLPDGSLTIAKNVVIRRDNIIESRRGFKLFGQSFGSSDDRAKQLMLYKNRILRHYQDILSFQDGTNNDGTAKFTNFNGSYTETETGLRIKSIEANKNFYFTTSEGIKKISAKTAADLTSNSGFITKAGGVKAIDLTTKLSVTDGDVSGFLPADSTVAYRAVWGITDRNDNLILGTPSERSEIYFSVLNLIIRDFMRLLGALDDINVSGSLIDDGDYVDELKVTDSSSASETRTNAILLATKIDEDILYAASSSTPLLLVATSAVIDTAICYVGFGATSDPSTDYFETGSLIFLKGFSPASGTLNGGQTILSAIHKPAQNFTDSDINTGTDVISITSHGLVDGDAVVFTTDGTLPPELATGTIYWVLNATPNDFQVEAVRGSGTPIDFSASGTGNNTVESNYITFSTAATGAVTLSTPKIESNIFRSIDEPDALSTLPTNQELTSLHDYIENIIFELQDLSTNVIPSSEKSEFIDVLDITTTANVEVSVTIPEDITTSYFLQVYRSAVLEALGTDVLSELVASDEMQLVYETFPTQAEIDAGVLSFIDITPDEFRGANLYTNAATGVGILQSNDIPPFAKDIALFRNYTFYANTQTRHRMFLNILGVTKFKSQAITSISASNPATITSANHGLSNGDLIKILDTNSNVVNGFHKIQNVMTNTFDIPVNGTGAGTGLWTNAIIQISDDNGTNQYSFISGQYESTKITCPIQADVPASGYFTLNSANNETLYYVWFDTTGSDTDPAVTGRIGIKIDVSNLTTDSEVADKVRDVINRYPYDFSAETTSADVTITNIAQGTTDDVELGALMAAAGFIVVVQVQGRGENLKQAINEITTVADIAGSLGGTAVLLNQPFGLNPYYLWFRVSGFGVDPAVPGRTGVQVDILLNDTADDVAIALESAINNIGTFITSVVSDTITLTTIGFGETDDPENYSVFSPGFTYNNVQKGALEVLLSSSNSPTIAVEETAKSLVRAINKNDDEDVYAYYLSGPTDVAGQMLLESRQLIVDANPFFVMATNDDVGTSFNPDLSPQYEATAISAASQTVITIANHGYTNDDFIIIEGSNSFPSIDGIHQISNCTTNTFTIPVLVATAGTIAQVSSANFAEFSTNEKKPNRIYFSKLQQPEAVPIVNFIDIGPEDEEIYRIFPLRSSLFIFKQAGLHRLSGETSPFNVELFDDTCHLQAPDSVSSIDNIIHCWTDGGITQVSESGVAVISNPIYDIVTKLPSNNFPNFKANTFSVGYHSDNSYIVWTIKSPEDEVATIAYRYSTLTRSWTTYDKTNTCVIVADDLLYLGAGDTNFLEQERKTYSRMDYADREVLSNLDPGRYFADGVQIRVSNTAQYEIGDVVTQIQFLTIYDYNSLLRKLDNDGGPSDDDYFSTLEAFGGDDLRTKIVALAQKLDADPNITASNFESSIDSKSGTVANATGHTIANPTVITSASHGLLTGRMINISGSTSTPTLNGNHEVTVIDANTFTIPIHVTALGTSGNFSWTTQDENFQDVKACYNEIISILNSDSGINFSNYKQIDTEALFEAVIDDIDTVTNTLFLNVGLEYIIGPLIIYHSIPTEFQYAPSTAGDPLGWKHFREATIMFQNKGFTRASLSFASDLFPAFREVLFDADTSGLFGNKEFGDQFFGGESNSAPLRTYIPRNHQRCRYLIVKFKHSTAREQYLVYGITLTRKEGVSVRAYRR